MGMRRLGSTLLLLFALGGPTWAAEPMDINSADQSALEQLPGIGPAKAKAIIAYRQEHGPFASVETLDAVPGIGPKLMEKLRDQVRVSPAAKTAPAPRTAAQTPAPRPTPARPAAIIQGQGQTRFFDAQGRPMRAPLPAKP